VDTLDLYHALYQFLGSLASIPLLGYWTIKGRFGTRWSDRLGFTVAGGKNPLWIHAVSVGETGSAIAVIKELNTLKPGLNYVLSVSTPLGLSYAKDALKKEGLENVGLLAPPIDVWGAPSRALKRIDPLALIIIETELWPGLIYKCQKMEIPVLIAAGRISQRSLSRYKLVKHIFGELLKKIDLIAATTKEDRQRFIDLGASPERVLSLGNPKFDKLIALSQNSTYTPSSLTAPFLVIAGSTHPGEEEIILQALIKLRLHRALSKEPVDKGRIKLILVPRHIGRAPEILQLALKNGFKAKILSDPNFDRDELPEVSVVNVLGRLMEFYAKADLALVGGSFVSGQGHNPLEPAALGRAVVIGPNMSSFSEQARFLMDNLGCKMVLPVNLNSVLQHFLDIPSVARNFGYNGRKAISSLKPAAPAISKKIVETLTEKGKL
jgi:3-deoxy-D-manno-octulosonic-acid transferase